MESIVIVAKKGYSYILAPKEVNEILKEKDPVSFNFICKGHRVLYSEVVKDKQDYLAVIKNLIPEFNYRVSQL